MKTKWNTAKGPKNKEFTVDNTVKSLPAGFFLFSPLKCRERQEASAGGRLFYMVTRGEPLRAPSTEASATVEHSMGKSDAKNAGDFIH